MPLNTQVIRDGEPLKIRWGGFHIAAMVVAASADSGIGPFEVNTMEGITGDADPEKAVAINRKDAFNLVMYPIIAMTPLNEGQYELKSGPYRFVDTSDGEEFSLLAGDVLVAFRD